MPASGDQNDFDTVLVGELERCEISGADLVIRIEERAVYIDGEEADVGLH